MSAVERTRRSWQGSISEGFEKERARSLVEAIQKIKQSTLKKAVIIARDVGIFRRLNVEDTEVAPELEGELSVGGVQKNTRLRLTESAYQKLRSMIQSIF